MLRCTLTVSLLVIATALALSAKAAHQIVGMELASFPGREALVIRTDGGVAMPASVSLNTTAAAASFILKDTAAAVNPPKAGLKLLKDVEVRNEGGGVRVSVKLADASLADSKRLRVTKPSASLIVLEVFNEPQSGEAARLTPNQLGETAELPARPAAKPAAKPAAAPKDVQTVDLRSSDPQRVLGLAAATGLLKLTGPSYIGTENMGQVSMKKAVFGLASWGTATPPGELYLSGSPEQISDFVRRASPQQLQNQPTVEEFWQANRPKRAQTGRMAAGRGAPAQANTHGNYTLPEFGDAETQLSDVRINLNAAGGFNLYEFLMYLSQISGISIIIDPYWFDDPTGNRPWREPLDPNQDGDGEGEPGFRPGDIFDPQLGSTGTVVGNFDNMPFDQALDLVLQVHGLQKVVYRNSSDPYSKPVILITSKERVEQELGPNNIMFNQHHYADPGQIRDILGNLGSMPSETQGWYVYGGGGNGNGGGGGQGGGQGGGGGIGGGGGLPSNYLASAKSGLLVYRGSTRQPILERVHDALDDGNVVVRVLLPEEQGKDKVTALVLP